MRWSIICCNRRCDAQIETIELGISPRGTLALFRSAQALALIEGRDYCIADDIKRLVVPCFAHRVIVNSRCRQHANKTREAERMLQEFLAENERARSRSAPSNEFPGA